MATARLILATVAALATASWAGPIAAQSAPAKPAIVRVQLPKCELLPFDAKQLLEHLRIELHALGIQGPDTDPPPAKPAPDGASRSAIIVIGVERCTVSSDVAIRLVDPRTSGTADRTLHLDDVSAALRPRTIAIAIVELVRSRWLGVATNQTEPLTQNEESNGDQVAIPTPSPFPPTTPVSEGAPSQPTSTAQSTEQSPFLSPVRTGVEVAAAGWIFPNRNTVLLGPTATVFLDSGQLRAVAGGHAAFGQASVDAGTVTMRWFSGYVGLGVHTRTAPRIGLEPRLYLGRGWARGQPTEPAAFRGSTTRRFVAAVATTGTARAHMIGPLELLLNIELGHAFHGTTFSVDDVPASGIEQIFVGAYVGLAIRP